MADALRQVRPHMPAPDANIQRLRAILDLPEEQIDLAIAKLTIDRMIDPGIDIAANLRLLDAMTAAIKAGWQLSHASNLDKMNALRTYLYKAGPWNGHCPVRYDYEDKWFNFSVRKKLLPNYLATRKGNCMSMPCLFVILGQKLGIDVTLSLSPSHCFINYRDEIGTFYLETTADDCGLTDEANLQTITPMTAESIANGVYLQPLSKRETVAAMLEPLMLFYDQQGLGEQYIAVAGLAYDYFPKNVNAMTHIGESFYKELKRVFLDKYPTPDAVPHELRPYFVYLSRNHRAWFHKAEALGWRKMDQATKAAYRERVERRRSVQ